MLLGTGIIPSMESAYKIQFSNPHSFKRLRNRGV